MCAASDRVLISSTPGHFEEPTHVNVREPAAWAASFAERGFFRRTDVDLSVFGPLGSAIRASRLDSARSRIPIRALRLPDARRSPREACGTTGCSPQARASPAILRRQLDEVTAANLELRHNLLTSRDHAIGAEAEAGQLAALGYEQAAAELDEVRRSSIRRTIQ